jgi:hypothetical protein
MQQSPRRRQGLLEKAKSYPKMPLYDCYVFNIFERFSL